MPIRPVLMAASAAIFGFSSPAAAQHHTSHHSVGERYEAKPVIDETGYDGTWQGEWRDSQTYEGEWRGTYTHAARNAHHPAGPNLAYSNAERDAWLADCRFLMADGGGYDPYYDDQRGPDGALIGGLLGAVVGGVAGNRIADGNRTAGTLIGAGLGGLAGAVAGDAIDGRNDRYYRDLDRNELWAARYCEAHLRRYELGGGADFHGDRDQLMLVRTASPTPRRRARDCDVCTTIVSEDVVSIDDVQPAPPPARPVVITRPAPRPDKRVRTGKRVRAD